MDNIFNQDEAKDIFQKRFFSYMKGYRNVLSDKTSTTDIESIIDQSYRVAQLQTSAETGHHFSLMNSSQLNSQLHSVATGDKDASYRSANGNVVTPYELLDEHMRYEGEISSVQKNVIGSQFDAAKNEILHIGDFKGTIQDVTDTDIPADQWINRDKYENINNPTDELRKRYINQDFYEEHEWAKINDIVYKHNNPQETINFTGIHGIEQDLMDMYPGEFERHTNAEVREAIAAKKDIAQQIIDEVNSDRRKFEVSRNLVNTAKKNNQSLYATMNSPEFKDTFISKALEERVAEGATDQEIRQHIGLILGSDKHINRPIEFNGNEADSNYRIKDAIQRNINMMYDDTDEKYTDYRKARKFSSDYNTMMNELYAERRLYATDFKEWMRFERENRQAREGMTLEERNVIADYTKSFVEMDEANQHFVEKHYEEMRKDPERNPASPLNQIRQKVASVLTEVNVEDSKHVQNAIANAIADNDLDAFKKAMSLGNADDHQLAIQFNKFRDLYLQDPAAFSYQIVQPATIEPKNQKQWTRFAIEHERVSIPGDKVAHEVKDFADGYVTLEAQHVRADELQVHLDIDADDIKSNLISELTEMEDMRYSSKNVSEQQRITDQHKIKESFIEISYEKQQRNANLHDTNKRLLDRLNQQEEFFKQIAADLHIETEQIVTRNVGLGNLMEQYYAYTSNMDPYLKDSYDTLRTNTRLPMFLQNMIRKDISWMQGTGRGHELQSLAMTSLADTFASYATDSKPIDLTDEGFRSLWESQGYSQDEISALGKSLADKTAKQRLDDYIAADVITHMHQNWFAEATGADRDGAVNNLLSSIEEDLLKNNALSEGSDYTASAQQIRNVLYQSKDTISKFPHYQAALNLSANDIAARLADKNSAAGATTTFEDYMSKVLNEGDELGGDERITVGDIVHGFEEGDVFDDLRDLDTEPGEIEELSSARRDLMVQRMSEGMTPKGTQDIEALMTIAEHKGLDRVEFTHGEDTGYIHRGSKGELLAYYPEQNKTVKVLDDGADAKTVYHTSEIEPRLHYGREPISEDIVQAGELQRNPYGSFEEYQRRGRGVIQSDPNVTMNLAKQFTSGDRSATYVDIETTGLTSDGIKPELIRPLEVYAQKMHWDPDAGEMISDPNESLHLIVRPSEAIKEHLDDLVNNEDFMVHTNDGPLSVLEYANNEALKKQGIIDVNPMDDKIAMLPNAAEVKTELNQKHSNLWFMRNIGKYGMLDNHDGADRFEMHTGNVEVPQEQLGTYIDNLKSDAQKGIYNLEHAGDQGDTRVVFADNQIAVNNHSTVAKMVNDFIGDDIVTGQNFAEADWQKIQDAANHTFDEVEKQVATAREGVKAQARTVYANQLEDVAFDLFNDLGVDDVYDFKSGDNSEPVTLNNRKLQSFIHKSLSEESGGDLTPRAVAHLAETDRPRYLQMTSDFIGRKIDEGQLIPSNFDFNDIEGTSKRIIEAVNFRDVEDMTPKLNAIRAINQNWKRVQKINNDSNPANDLLHGLIDSGHIDGVEYDNALREFETTKANLAEVNFGEKQLMEQLFLSKTAHPEARRHHAEAQIERAGIPVSDNLHMAAADVDQGIQVVGSHLKKILATDTFQNYQPDSIKVGDVLEHHRQLRADIPLGIYRVNEVDPTGGYTIQDRDFNTHRIEAPSTLERNRGFYKSFNFLGAEDSEEAIAGTKAYDMDVAREQISKINGSAYAHELHDLQSQEIEKDNIAKMKSVYDSLSEAPANEGTATSADNVLNHVAASSHGFLNDEAYHDWSNKDTTGRQRRAYETTRGYLESTVGKKQGEFLRNVDNLQKTGVVNASMAKDMIREMNEATKAKGRELGFTREVPGKSALGVLDKTFGSYAGNTFSVDTSSPSKLIQSLWQKAGAMSNLAGMDIPETERKERVLNQKILPFLKDQGYIETTSDGNMPTVSAAAQQIMNKELPAFNEVDFTRHKEMDASEDFLAHMDQTSKEILEGPQANLTPMQEQRMQIRNEMIDTLKSEGAYHPSLNIEPKVADVIESTVNFNGYENLADYSPQEMKQVADSLDARDIKQYDLKNRIYNQLYNEATLDRDGSLNGEVTPESQPRKYEARRALNWIDENGAGTPIEERYLGAKMPVKHGDQYSSWKIKELPRQLIDGIEQGQFKDYTSNDESLRSLFDDISDWKQSGMPGRLNSAPDDLVYKNYSNSDNVSKEQLSSMTNARKVSDGDTAAAEQRRENVRTAGLEVANEQSGLQALNTTEKRAVSQLPQSQHREPGLIEQHLTSSRQKARELGDNLATMLRDTGGGKAAAWIAGIGLGAYALNQFAKANDPLKFERKDTGHGVTGVEGDEEAQKQPDLPSGGGPPTTSYQTVPSSGKGYQININADTDNDEAVRQMQAHVQNNIGEASFNVNDHRQNLDRGWLENQMSTYMERGHL